MDFVDKVEMLRERMRLSQQDLARQCGISQAQISQWKSTARRGPSLYVAARVARVLGVSIDYLADDTLVELPKTITPEERMVLDAYRRSGLGPAEAADWLYQGRDARQRKPIDDGTPISTPTPGRDQKRRGA